MVGQRYFLFRLGKVCGFGTMCGLEKLIMSSNNYSCIFWTPKVAYYLHIALQIFLLSKRKQRQHFNTVDLLQGMHVSFKKRVLFRSSLIILPANKFPVLRGVTPRCTYLYTKYTNAPASGVCTWQCSCLWSSCRFVHSESIHISSLLFVFRPLPFVKSFCHICIPFIRLFSGHIFSSFVFRTRDL